jgi:hypothetical protein
MKAACQARADLVSKPSCTTGCLHAGLCSAAERSPMLTFDVKAARLAGVALMPA